MLSKLVSQVVVFGTPLIMVCLFIAFIGLFIYFNRRIDRMVDRVNTLSELVSVLQDLVNTRPVLQQQQAPVTVQEQSQQPQEEEESKIVHVQSAAGEKEKIVVSDDEEDYVSSSEEDEEEIDLTIEDEDAEPMITITKIEHSPEPETKIEHSPEEHSPEEHSPEEHSPEEHSPEEHSPEPEHSTEPEVDIVEEITPIGIVDDDMISVVSMSVIPEPQLEEICTNAVLKERFLSTNYRGYKVNQLRDLATELHLIGDKEAAKLKKSELLTFLDKTYVGLKNEN